MVRLKSMLWHRVFTVLLSFVTIAANADFEAGGDAYKRGNYQTAAKEFLAVAEKGDHRAMYALGSMYAAGNGVPQDYTLAMTWFLAAARYGRPDAECKIGLLYLQGLGVEQNSRRALNWFGKSAKKGYAQSQYYVGKMIAEGNGATQNNVEAYAWTSLAAEQGLPEAGALLENLSQNMTTDQMQKGRQLYESFSTQYTKQH